MLLRWVVRLWRNKLWKRSLQAIMCTFIVLQIMRLGPLQLSGSQASKEGSRWIFPDSRSAAEVARELETLEFKEALRSVARSNWTVLLSMTDSGMEEMSINFYLGSITPLAIHNYLFFSTDAPHCRRLRDLGAHCFIVERDSISSQACAYREAECMKKMKLRLQMVLTVLRLGYNVLLSDVDIVLFEDPMKHLTRNYDKSVDIIMSENSGKMPRKQLNGGFIFFRNSEAASSVVIRALDIMDKDLEKDDQIALNDICTRGHRKDFKLGEMPVETYLNGRQFWEIPTYSREFASEAKPCNGCVMVHNNWIVSMEAKRYRMKENGFWLIDHNQYYSSTTASYMTYIHSKRFLHHKEAVAKEWVALQNALYIAESLNRVLILPKFHCVTKNKTTQNCTLLHRLRLNKFESYFHNYREEEFLSHPLVPVETKSSQSGIFCFAFGNSTKRLSPMCQDKFLITTSDPGIRTMDIINTLRNSNHKVLRYFAIYENLDFSHLNGFNDKVKNGFEHCEYRQY